MSLIVNGVLCDACFRFLLITFLPVMARDVFHRRPQGTFTLFLCPFRRGFGHQARFALWQLASATKEWRPCKESPCW